MPPPVTQATIHERTKSTLPDVQKSHDTRGVLIEKVGVKNIRYPIQVRDRERMLQTTVATINMYVELPAHFKGTHMSRFLEILNLHCGEFTSDSPPEMLRQMLKKLEARTAHIEMEFPYFLRRKAPVSGLAGMMEYTVGLSGSAGEKNEVEMSVIVPVATLCPCSKKISERGAHNQRGHVTLRVEPEGFLWFEELIEIAEKAGSCPLYPILKRPDEKYVTEFAYDHPRFVEDVLREAAVALRQHPKIRRYKIEVENFESIHAHNAYASTSSQEDGIVEYREKCR